MEINPTTTTEPIFTKVQDASPAWTREEFETQLRAKGTAYHIHHPFNVKMNGGGCSKEQIRGWVANRFYYQINIPLKDAAVISNCPDRETRRRWVLRILDHDGYEDQPGGIEAWARLGRCRGSLARRSLVAQTGYAGRSLRRRCLCEFRTPGAVARVGVFIADGNVCAADS